MRRLWAWLRALLGWTLHTPAALGLSVVGLVLGGVAGKPVGDATYTYMWRDARFCDDCHVHDYANDNFAKSVHARLTTCHDCHRVPIRHYPKNLWVTVTDTPETPEDIPKAEVGVIICEQCHSAVGAEEPLTGPMPEEIRAHVVRIDDSPLHQRHLSAEDRDPGRYRGGKGDEAAGEIECLDCHGGEDQQVHRFGVDDSPCTECHQDLAPKDEVGNPLSCLDCHARGFLGKQP